VTAVQLLAIALILLIGGTFIVAAAIAPFVNRYRRRGMRVAAALASVLLIVGAAGFFGRALSAAGGLNWLPPSFEWPVGYADGVVSMPGGTHVVPHTPSGRVQVYDQDWRFVRGWHVDASGGTFKLREAGDDRIDVITARGSWRYTYTLGGDLIARVNYSPASYSSFPDRGERRVVPTPPWLWIISSPAVAWAVLFLGACVMIVLERKVKRPVAVQSAAASRPKVS
jgi:hypothetical protein